jgi:hypothetical protein
MSDHVYFTSLISDTSHFNSDYNSTLFLTSKIDSNRISGITKAAVFGQIIFNESIFGYSVQYGSNLKTSLISDTIELISGLQDSKIYINSKLQEVT